MRRNSRLLSAASGLAVALSLSAPALADAICPLSANGACITGNNLPQEIFASAVGADNIEVVSPGFSWTPAVYRSNSGTATFGAMDFIAGPVMTNDPAPDVSTYSFSANPSATETFAYAGITNSDSLTALITWNNVQFFLDTGAVELFGTADLLTAMGDPSDMSFDADFSIPGNLDVNIDCAGFVSTCSFDAVSETTLPPVPPLITPPLTVPEPSTLYLLGSALIGLLIMFEGTSYYRRTWRRDIARLPAPLN